MYGLNNPDTAPHTHSVLYSVRKALTQDTHVSDKNPLYFQFHMNDTQIHNLESKPLCICKHNIG